MANFKEVLLIVNPISGDVPKEKIIKEVEENTIHKGAGFHLYTTNGENDIENIQSFIKESGIDRVLVAGGDGTINLVAEAIKSYNFPLGIIPAGSANGLSTNLNLPKKLNHQIEIALGENFINMDILCLNDIICLHMSDLGINAELIRNYESSPIRGKFGYLIQSVPTLLQSEYPFHFEIKTDSEQREAEAVLLGIVNGNKYGTGANVNPKGKLDDGKFEILVFRRLNVIDILNTLREEAEPDPEFMEILQTTSATIHCKKPVAFQIDGEYIGEKEKIKIKILEEKIKIAVP